MVAFAVRLMVSVVAWAYLAVTIVVYFVLLLVMWLLLMAVDRNLVVQHLFTGLWARMYFMVHPGWRLRIEGRSKLPWRGAAVIVANHQSLLDALVMFAVLRPFKPVSKASVQWVPVFGWAMMMNRYIRLQRGQRRSIARMSRLCRYWLRRGMPVMLYPEGTRSRDGQIHGFKNGAFTLAVEENCPIYPVVITGTRDALPADSILLGLKASIRARVLDPVRPDDPAIAPPGARPKERAAALRDHVRRIMVQELDRLRAQTAGP